MRKELLLTLKTYVSLFRRESNEIQKRLGRMPEGTVHTCSKGKNAYYYHYRKGDKKYLRHGDPMIKILFQKEYYIHERKNLCQIIAVLEAAVRKLERLSADYKKPEPYIEEFKTVDMVGKEWCSVRGEDNDHTVLTDKGDFVRSKAEALIANMLHRLGIPYIYEKKVIFNGNVLYPDFCILNVRTGDIVILEHLGLMGNQDYAEKNIRKINNYLRAGYVMGKTLLISMESNGKDIDMAAAESMIKTACL